LKFLALIISSPYKHGWEIPFLTRSLHVELYWYTISLYSCNAQFMKMVSLVWKFVCYNEIMVIEVRYVIINTQCSAKRTNWEVQYIIFPFSMQLKHTRSQQKRRFIFSYRQFSSFGWWRFSIFIFNFFSYFRFPPGFVMYCESV
jgi:hypothetical protein